MLLRWVFFAEVRVYFLAANCSCSYLRYQLFVMFNFEYTQIIKTRTAVSSRTTESSESTLEACNTRGMSDSSWLQTLIT